MVVRLLISNEKTSIFFGLLNNFFDSIAFVRLGQDSTEALPSIDTLGIVSLPYVNVTSSLIVNKYSQ